MRSASAYITWVTCPETHFFLKPHLHLASPPPSMVSLQESFFIGGAAACTAVTVSNPFEVAKVRMQLQGELSRNGGERVYRNVGDVLSKTWRNEGIKGLQRGLVPAVCPSSFKCLLCGLMDSVVHLSGMGFSRLSGSHKLKFP